MRTQKCSTETASRPLPALHFSIAEAAQILRMSRALLYNRICGLVTFDAAPAARTRSGVPHLHASHVARLTVSRGLGHRNLLRLTACGRSR